MKHFQNDALLKQFSKAPIFVTFLGILVSVISEDISKGIIMFLYNDDVK